MKRLSLTVIALTFAACSSASATTVSFETSRPGGYDTPPLGVLSVTGNGAEVNVPRITFPVPNTAVVTDVVPVSAGAGCRSQESNTVICTSAGGAGVAVDVRGGDGADNLLAPVGDRTYVRLFGDAGDDTLAASSIGGYMSGGDGADRLVGSVVDDYVSGDAGRDVLVGVEGNDTLIGGSDTDELQGGPGGDWLEGGGGRDRIDGGPDGDTADYGDHQGPVRVDLAQPRPSQEDRLIDVENLTGGAGVDHLAGDAGSNDLRGAPSPGHSGDVLIGRDGDDSLTGGSGQDRLLGGAGNDALEGYDRRDVILGGPGDDRIDTGDEFGHGARGPLRCGPGSDYAYGFARDQLVPNDCEKVGIDDLSVDLTNRRQLGVQWESLGTSLPCRVAFRVERAARPHRLLATGAARRPNRKTPVTAQVRPVARAPRRGRRVRLKVSVAYGCRARPLDAGSILLPASGT